MDIVVVDERKRRVVEGAPPRGICRVGPIWMCIIRGRVMKHSIRMILAAGLIILRAMDAMAIEAP
jgi:hypothetical protein